MTSHRQVRIVIRGTFGERFASFFDGLDVVAGRGQTELRGEIVDQAHLHGLLARIRDLRLELESVALEPAPARPSSHQASTTSEDTDIHHHSP
jgi:hypothetical protein